MNEAHLSALADSAETMAEAAGKLIREAAQRPFATEIKGDGSPVTDVDKATEDSIREIITNKYPQHGILGEERAPVAPDAEFVWIIDPIDGTLPFLAGIPVFGTLIALMQGDTPLVGVIDMPMTRERWVGKHGMHTLRNGKPVSARACAGLSSALMSTSNPDYYDQRTVGALTAMKEATRLAVYGGSCMSYAQIATGRVDVGMDVQFDIHDYLPLVPVIQGAGGLISDWEGRPLTRKSGDKFIAAGDRRVHEQALTLLG
ncbi:MAG: inositol monophosphatase family protein [Alphaproteobacteria bacterium]